MSRNQIVKQYQTNFYLNSLSFNVTYLIIPLKFYFLTKTLLGAYHYHHIPAQDCHLRFQPLFYPLSWKLSVNHSNSCKCKVFFTSSHLSWLQIISRTNFLCHSQLVSLTNTGHIGVINVLLLCVAFMFCYVCVCVLI